MSAKIDYLKSEVIGVLSQLDADRGRSKIRRLCNKALKQLTVREELGEEPVGGNVSSLLNEIYSAIESLNAQTPITVKSKADIMAGFDAAVDEVVEE